MKIFSPFPPVVQQPFPAHKTSAHFMGTENTKSPLTSSFSNFSEVAKRYFQDLLAINDKPLRWIQNFPNREERKLALQELEAAGFIQNERPAETIEAQQKNELLKLALQEVKNRNLSPKTPEILLALMLQGINFQVPKELTIQQIKSYINPQKLMVESLMNELIRKNFVQKENNHYLLPSHRLQGEPTPSPTTRSSSLNLKFPSTKALSEKQAILIDLIPPFTTAYNVSRHASGVLKKLVELGVFFESNQYAIPLNLGSDSPKKISSSGPNSASYHIQHLIDQGWLRRLSDVPRGQQNYDLEHRFTYLFTDKLQNALMALSKDHPEITRPIDASWVATYPSWAQTQHEPLETYLAALELEPRFIQTADPDFPTQAEQNLAKALLRGIAQSTYAPSGWAAFSKETFLTPLNEKQKTILQRLIDKHYLYPCFDTTGKSIPSYRLASHRPLGLFWLKAYSEATTEKKPALLRVLKNPNLPVLAKWVYIGIQQNPAVNFKTFTSVDKIPMPWYIPEMDKTPQKIAEMVHLLTKVNLLKNEPFRYLEVENPTSKAPGYRLVSHTAPPKTAEVTAS